MTDITLTPVSFDPAPTSPSAPVDWGKIETEYILFWRQSSHWFNVPPRLSDKAIVCRIVLKSGANSPERNFCLLNDGNTADVKSDPLGVAYNLYSQRVKVFPLIPNADCIRAGIFVGLQKVPSAAPSLYEERYREFNNDFAIASQLADKTNKPVSVRVILCQNPDFPDVKAPRLAGGDFVMDGDIYPPTGKDAGRIPVSDTKARMVASWNQEDFYRFLVDAGILVERLDRKLKIVERVCCAK
jgi:hypothetical protein